MHIEGNVILTPVSASPVLLAWLTDHAKLRMARGAHAEGCKACLIPVCKQGSGMLGMHRHGELLGGNDKERCRRERAACEHAPTLEMEDGGGAGLLLKPAGVESAACRSGNDCCQRLWQGPL